jgi:Planctomycete cytochrome C
MKKISILLTVFILIIYFLGSCKHEPVGIPLPAPGSGGGGATGGTQTCSADTVYFQNKVLPLLISSCAKSNCHDAASHQDGIELTSYQKIMTTADVDPGDPNGSKLYKVLNETDPTKIMPRPPSSSLTQAEKDLIYKWILQGAKNNACNDCDTTTITYSAAVVPIINTNCKGCHNPNFLSGNLDLTSYTNVKTIALNGKLMGSVDHLPGFPAMPKGAAKLTDCKITQIKKWIAAGALNN